MDALKRTVLSMIKTTLWGEPFSREEGITDEDKLREALRYELVGFLSGRLDDFCRDDATVRNRWSKRALADYHKSLRVLAAQASLCSILGEYAIKPVFLKGMASAWYYPNPLLRHIGDIDFLVPPEQFDECCRVLEKNGYERGHDGTRHLAFEKRGLEYECHRYFSLNASDFDRAEDEMLYEGCRNCITRDIDGKKYYALPDVQYGLVLLEHMKHHLYDGMGFRQYIDWVVYADRVLDDAAWGNIFSGMARKSNLERLAKVMTKTAQLYLGLRKDGITWCDDVEEEICIRLIQYIFSCGNFGVPSEGKEEAHIIGNIYRKGLFRSLDASATTHIPISKKLVFLRPIAWLYQVLRWGVNGVLRLLAKGDGGSVSVKELNRQKNLLKDLGV